MTSRAQAPRRRKRRRLGRKSRVWLSVVGTVAGTGAFTVGAVQLAGARDTDLADASGDVSSRMTSSAVAATSPIRFTDVTEEAGVRMRHGPGARTRALPEDTGSGIAWGDVDGDGDWDLYVVNYPGGASAEDGGGGSPPGDPAGSNRLYRNDGGGRFTDVTAEAGVGDPQGFGMGASFADYDGDGDEDLYVTNDGPNRLFRNRGDGRFDEVAEAAGVAHPAWSTGAAWGDVDRDGDLDLYVCNYVDFVAMDPETGFSNSAAAGVEGGIPVSLNPNAFDPVANAYYRNEGDGRFTEVSAAAGIANPGGRSLEAVFCDLDGDGWLDLYVNNDVSTNKLFRNLGGMDELLFADLSTLTGTADPRGSMGLSVGEFGGMGGEADGLPDLFITHWVAQENALYRSVAHGSGEIEYRDQVQLLRLGEVSISNVGWGTAVADLDLDGRDDLVVANGSTLEDRDDARRLTPEPLFLFWSDGAVFHEAAPFAGEALAQPYVARGLAAADWDGDGDVDLAVNVNRGAPLLLRNDTETGHRALSIRLEAPAALATGARIEVVAGGRRVYRWWIRETSFCSAHAPEQIVGLGLAASAELVRVRWMDGRVTERRDVPAGVVTLRP